MSENSNELKKIDNDITKSKELWSNVFNLKEDRQWEANELKKITNNISEIDVKTKEKQGVLDTRTKDREGKTQERTRVQNDIKNAIWEKNKLSKSVSDRKKTIETKKQELEVFESYEPDSEETKNRRAEIVALELKNVQEEAQIKALEAKIAQLQAQERQLEMDIKKLSDEISILGWEVAELVADRQKAVDEQTDINKSIAKLDKKIEELDTKVQKIEQSVSESQQMYAENSRQEELEKPDKNFFKEYSGAVWAV